MMMVNGRPCARTYTTFLNSCSAELRRCRGNHRVHEVLALAVGIHAFSSSGFRGKLIAAFHIAELPDVEMRFIDLLTLRHGRYVEVGKMELVRWSQSCMFLAVAMICG